MTIKILVVVGSLLSSLAFAGEKGDSKTARKVATTGPALLEEIPQATYVKLEDDIKKALRENASTKLKNFKVDWNGVRDCIETKNEMDGKRLGICMVDFSAFQVMGKAAILIARKGTSIQIIDLTIE